MDVSSEGFRARAAHTIVLLGGAGSFQGGHGGEQSKEGLRCLLLGL